MSGITGICIIKRSPTIIYKFKDSGDIWCSEGASHEVILWAVISPGVRFQQRGICQTKPLFQTRRSDPGTVRRSALGSYSPPLPHTAANSGDTVWKLQHKDDITPLSNSTGPLMN